MSWKLVFALVFLLLITIFSIQNYEVVEIQFLLWSFQASRVIIIFLTFVTGVIIGSLVTSQMKKK